MQEPGYFLRAVHLKRRDRDMSVTTTSVSLRNPMNHGSAHPSHNRAVLWNVLSVIEKPCTLITVETNSITCPKPGGIHPNSTTPSPSLEKSSFKNIAPLFVIYSIRSVS
jgi:hypothetical protein